MKSKKLSEIADINSGIGYRTDDLVSGDIGFPFFTITNIQPLYELSFAEKFIKSIDDKEHYKLQQGDILISKIGANIKFGFVKDQPEKPSFYSSNLIRVRLKNNENLSHEQLLNYLSSTVIDELRGKLKGVAQPHITNEDLGNIEIIIDADDNIEISPINHVIKTLEDNISKLKLVTELKNAETIFLEIGEIVKVPDQKQEVLLNFPYPIALRYSQYLDSAHDQYQQLTRLRDVFESIVFFLYSIFLKDYLLNVDKSLITLESNQRKAYNGYSIAFRLAFLTKMVETYRGSLFLNDLSLETIQDLATSQEDFRNKISHTSTLSEKQAKDLNIKYYAILEKVLNNLEFIKDYNLVRIRSWSYKGKLKTALTETYRGLKPKIEHEIFEGDFKEDSNHILLINTSNDELTYINLFPFYQVISNEDTKNQEFMAFMKQRKTYSKVLQGECIPWTFELELEGYDYLDSLLSNEM